MTEETKTYEADDPANPNNLVVRGSDGDPLPHPSGTRMIEKESYERVVEGLKMAADACQHIAKGETVQASTWIDIGQMLDKMRREAVALAGLDLAMKQNETRTMRGEPIRGRSRASVSLMASSKRPAACGNWRHASAAISIGRSWRSNLSATRKASARLLLGIVPSAMRRPRPGKLILPPGFSRH